MFIRTAKFVKKQVKKVNSFLLLLTSLSSDKFFLEKFKGNWNRFCNLYKPRKRNISQGEFEIERQEESFIPVKVDLLKDFGRFYEIYLKHKFLPDTKFANKLDTSFSTTVRDMHNILGENPYPQERNNSIDAAYDVRYRKIILIEYLIRLSSDPYRYIGLLIVRISIYLAAPVGVATATIFLYQQIFG